MCIIVCVVYVEVNVLFTSICILHIPLTPLVHCPHGLLLIMHHGTHHTLKGSVKATVLKLWYTEKLKSRVLSSPELIASVSFS